VPYLSASAVVFHYEEALYQVYAPLPLPYLLTYWHLTNTQIKSCRHTGYRPISRRQPAPLLCMRNEKNRSRCIHDSSSARLPQVISPTEQQVCLGVERRADLAEATVAARTLETVLVPVAVERAQQIALGDGLLAAGAVLTVDAARRRRGRRRLQTPFAAGAGAAELAM